MPNTTFEEFRALAAPGGLVPVTREFSADTLTPVTAFAAIRRAPFGFLLESLVGGERWARYTFLGSEPRAAWRYVRGAVSRWTRDGGWEAPEPAANPLGHVGDRMRSARAIRPGGLPRFIGGAVGYLGYDIVRALERLPGGPADDLAVPDAVFLETDTLVIIDNLYARATLLATASVAPHAGSRELARGFETAAERLDALEAQLSKPPALRPLSLDRAAALRPTSPYSREDFQRDVGRIQEHIRAGDAFQVVLSRRQEVPCPGDPFDVYRALRMLNPAPYLFYLELDGLHLVGSSPEVLVRVEDGAVTVRPIAGTRPRGATSEEDERLAEELLGDEKELAEHAMLVDLGRNDVGRVAAFGTVRVTVDKTIERYSHVQHIVSQVQGMLRPGLDAIDALAACFPAGTVSGAPKIRAMEIIDELEPTRRGPYAGAVGYVGWGASALDTAITIRTALITNGRAFVQAGAGIVADSVPEREFLETESKAGAVLRALALAAE
jgi:anthranilate synthase component 1